MIYASCMLHNTIIKDEGKALSPVHMDDPLTNEIFDDNIIWEFQDLNMHHRLRYNLFEHIFSIQIWT